MHAYLNLVIVLAVLILPMLLGGYLARWLRMPEYAWKFALILFAVGASVAVLRAALAAQAGRRPLGRRDPRLRSGPGQKVAGQAVDMDKLIGRLRAHQSRRAEGSHDPPLRRRRRGNHHPLPPSRRGTQRQAEIAIKDNASAMPAPWSSASWPTTATTARSSTGP